MERVFKYEKDDWLRFQSFLVNDLCSAAHMWHHRAWFSVVSWFIVTLAFFVFFQSRSEFSWSTAAIVAFLFACAIADVWLTGFKFKKLSSPAQDGIFIGEHRFRFDDSAIHTEGKGYSATHHWKIVRRVARTDHAIYVFLDTAYAYVFPLSQLDDPDAFYKYLDDRINISRLPA